VARSLAEIVEGLGHRPIVVDRSMAALERIGAERFDVVFADLRMPGLDGIALARRLRARRPGLPVLLVSGYADAGAREALEGLDVAFLPKPYRLADLRRSLESLV
ncbi:MAG: response regulator, partial [Thermaurantiacus tibetensis]